ncbi:MAG: hypothetical protein E5W82_10655 [Mesorhizobium sp.]|nr:MAG: hypothetical protein E5W82_10655 [Mesorhizobium sp.]
MMLKRFQIFAEDHPMTVFWWIIGIVGWIVFSVVFIHYDRISIEEQLQDCPFLVMDFTIGKEICVSPQDYDAYWRGDCPGAEAVDGKFECAAMNSIERLDRTKAEGRTP